ncbi:Acetyl esterase/lipase [Sediminibacterium ginsengisoli]|uniref:Acetyl esterase/lipase n=1 Tax=Sediminibacterium ginsengisoli TaxID=413434 RepID=A0A1T4P9A3_9BACT|nr:Acetyl esterase/lipase [Sediminibacterium ginsengisoli]
MKRYMLICFILFSAWIYAGAQDSSVKKTVFLPADYTASLDVVYKKADNWDGRMDIYLPPASGKTAPLLINIHGGAWRKGRKEDQSGFDTYFKLGFAVANISYRLSPEAKAPAAVEDARCALMYMVKHAAAMNIDVNRIVFAGSSAGAHLALLAGLTADNHIFDKGCEVAGPFRIAAVIAQSTPAILYDSLPDGRLKVLPDDAIYEWLGENRNNAAFAKMLSPVTYVAKNNPPVFLTHGDADPRVPYGQSVLLDKLFTGAGVPHTFITVPGGLHGGYPKEKQQEIKAAITDFLQKQVLK